MRVKLSLPHHIPNMAARTLRIGKSVNCIHTHRIHLKLPSSTNTPRPHPRRRHRPRSHPRRPPHPRSPPLVLQPKILLHAPRSRLVHVPKDRRRPPRRHRLGPQVRLRWRPLRSRQLAHRANKGLLESHCCLTEEDEAIRQRPTRQER